MKEYVSNLCMKANYRKVFSKEFADVYILASDFLKKKEQTHVGAEQFSV